MEDQPFDGTPHDPEDAPWLRRPGQQAGPQPPPDVPGTNPDSGSPPDTSFGTSTWASDGTQLPWANGPWSTPDGPAPDQQQSGSGSADVQLPGHYYGQAAPGPDQSATDFRPTAYPAAPAPYPVVAAGPGADDNDGPDDAGADYPTAQIVPVREEAPGSQPGGRGRPGRTLLRAPGPRTGGPGVADQVADGEPTAQFEAVPDPGSRQHGPRSRRPQGPRGPGGAPRRGRRRRGPLLILLILLAAAVIGLAGLLLARPGLVANMVGMGHGTKAQGSNSAAAPAPTRQDSGLASQGATPGGVTSGSPSPGATAPSSPAPATSNPSPSAGAALPPGGTSQQATVCLDTSGWNTQPQIVAGTIQPPPITSISPGIHANCDRLVLVLKGDHPYRHGAKVGFEAGYARRILTDPKGDLLPLGGSPAIKLVIHAPSQLPVHSGYVISPDQLQQLAAQVGGQFKELRWVKLAGNFEGQATLVIGVAHRHPFAAFAAVDNQGNLIVVIDIAARTHGNMPSPAPSSP